MLGVSVIDVSEAPLDVEGLRERWLGKPLLPDLTKEGVVRCVDRVYETGGRVETHVFTQWPFCKVGCLKYCRVWLAVFCMSLDLRHESVPLSRSKCVCTDTLSRVGAGTGRMCAPQLPCKVTA